MEIIAAHKCLGCTVNDLEVGNKIDFLCRPGAMRSLESQALSGVGQAGELRKDSVMHHDCQHVVSCGSCV